MCPFCGGRYECGRAILEDIDHLLDGNHAVRGFASRWTQAGDRDHAVLSVVDVDAGAADRVMASTKRPSDVADKSPSGPADVMRAPRSLCTQRVSSDAIRKADRGASAGI